MVIKASDLIKNLFHPEEKEQEEEEKKTNSLQLTTQNIFGQNKKPTYNPFLKDNGELRYPLLNYQKLLDNPNISKAAKNYITQATGLSPTVTETPQITPVEPTPTEQPTPTEPTPKENPTQPTENPAQPKEENPAPVQPSGGGSYADSVGKKVAKGQCVWYVRGRMKEKFGKDTGAIGNGNEMWYNAKSSAKLSAKEENIKPNTIASYKYGSGGNKYGHVIYIEDVVGDTVYYTEGGTYYTKNGTTGVVKTASKSEILNGGKVGKNLIGFIDVTKY